MQFFNEDSAKAAVDEAVAYAAIEDVFASAAKGTARNFPVVREAIGHADALWGFKSGIDTTSMTLGLKAGGYWPHNMDAGRTNHQSTVLLFDPDSGQLSAVVSGNYLTAMRTGAACAVAINHLARKSAKVLGIIGAGHQSTFQLRAAARQRRFERVLAWNIDQNGVSRLAKVAGELGLPFEFTDRDKLCANADVIITITSCNEALLDVSQIRPGTHISCMGTDTIGKQEIDPQILGRARVFCDERAQAILLGECQHAVKAGLLHPDAITPIGEVIAGRSPGRTSEADITVFDGTGVGLQDLAVARRVVDAA